MARAEEHRRPGTRRHAWLVYVVLVVIGVPWYLGGAETRSWLGVPVWVWVAIAASAVASMWTAWLLARPWPEEDEEEAEP